MGSQLQFAKSFVTPEKFAVVPIVVVAREHNMLQRELRKKASAFLGAGNDGMCLESSNCHPAQVKSLARQPVDAVSVNFQTQRRQGSSSANRSANCSGLPVY
jgi:hypothetical protein